MAWQGFINTYDIVDLRTNEVIATGQTAKDLEDRFGIVSSAFYDGIIIWKYFKCQKDAKTLEYWRRRYAIPENKLFPWLDIDKMFFPGVGDSFWMYLKKPDTEEGMGFYEWKKVKVLDLMRKGVVLQRGPYRECFSYWELNDMKLKGRIKEAR